MERHAAWDLIRETIPSKFYHKVKADTVEKEIRLSLPILRGLGKFTPFTELERYHRELAELDERLEKQRQLCEEDQHRFQQRWEIAYEKQQDLEQILLKFGKYFEDCQQNVEHGNLRKDLAISEGQEEDKEIQRLQIELDLLTEVKHDIETRRGLCEPKKFFLERVVRIANAEAKERAENINNANGTITESGSGTDATESNLSNGDENYALSDEEDDTPDPREQFSTIYDLIGRYYELKRLRNEMEKMAMSNLNQVVQIKEEEHAEKQKFLVEEESYQVHLSALSKYKEQLQAHNEGLEDKITHLKGKGQEEIWNAEQTKTAIFTLYSNMATKIGRPIEVTETDVKGQLESIQQFLLEIGKISTIVNECWKGEGSIFKTTTSDE